MLVASTHISVYFPSAYTGLMCAQCRNYHICNSCLLRVMKSTLVLPNDGAHGNCRNQVMASWEFLRFWKWGIMSSTSSKWARNSITSRLNLEDHIDPSIFSTRDVVLRLILLVAPKTKTASCSSILGCLLWANQYGLEIVLPECSRTSCV